MSNKEIAADITKTYIQAYVSGVFADPQAIFSAKTGTISVSKFTDVYKKFYEMLSEIPDEK